MDNRLSRVGTRRRLALLDTLEIYSMQTTAAPIDRMALRLDEVAATLGMSRRTVERLRSGGRFPKPDVKAGRMPLWKPETIKAWIDGN